MAKLNILEKGRTVVLCSPYEKDCVLVRVGQDNKTNIIDVVLNEAYKDDMDKWWRIHSLLFLRQMTEKEIHEIANTVLEKYDSMSLGVLFNKILGRETIIKYMCEVITDKKYITDDISRWNTGNIQKHIIDPVMNHDNVRTAQESKREAFRIKWTEFIIAVSEDLMLKVYQHREKYTFINEDVIGPLSYLLNIKVIIVGAMSRRLDRVYNLGGKRVLMFLAHQNEETQLIHLEIIGRLSDGNIIETVFENNDQLIIRIMEDVPRIY